MELPGAKVGWSAIAVTTIVHFVHHKSNRGRKVFFKCDDHLSKFCSYNKKSNNKLNAYYANCSLIINLSFGYNLNGAFVENASHLLVYLKGIAPHGFFFFWIFRSALHYLGSRSASFPYTIKKPKQWGNKSYFLVQAFALINLKLGGTVSLRRFSNSLLVLQNRRSTDFFWSSYGPNLHGSWKTISSSIFRPFLERKKETPWWKWVTVCTLLVFECYANKNDDMSDCFQIKMQNKEFLNKLTSRKANSCPSCNYTSKF